MYLLLIRPCEIEVIVQIVEKENPLEQRVVFGITTYVYDAPILRRRVKSSETDVDELAVAQQEATRDVTTYIYSREPSRLIGIVYSSGERVNFTFSESSELSPEAEGDTKSLTLDSASNTNETEPGE